MFPFFLTFSWHYFSLKLKSTGTIDIEVAAKLALGAGKQEDLEQERLELQVTRLIYVCSYVRSERGRERETCFPASKKLIFNLNIINFFFINTLCYFFSLTLPLSPNTASFTEHYLFPNHLLIYKHHLIPKHYLFITRL